MIFLKTTLLRGLFALLPVVITLYIMVQTVVGVRGVAKQWIGVLADIPEESVPYPTLIALGILLLASFLLGLLIKGFPLSRRLGRWTDQTLLRKIPGYQAIRTIVSGFSGGGVVDGIKPALLSRGDGSRVIAYLIEDHGDGNVTVLLPSAPSAAIGTVAVYPKESLIDLDVSLGTAVTTLNHWGVGMHDLMKKGLPKNCMK